MKSHLKLTVLAVSAALAGACSADATDASPSPEALSQTMKASVATYAEIVHATYEDSLSSADAMESAVSAFVEAPDAASMEAAKDAWLAAREPYLQSEVFRFYDGPIDRAEEGPEGLLNAWPLDEAYIDYVEGNAGAGLIADDSVTIDKATLAELNEAGGEKNIATGYHAIEFLLWGQDLNPEGPGDRSFIDYTPAVEGHARRRLYLETSADLLTDHLEWLVAEWSPGASNYRAEFEAGAPESALRKILTGMVVLSGFETGGERLQVALDSGDQEDEHSCFSDNTHRDMIQDIRGVQNVYLGRYQRVDGSMVSGTGVKDVIAVRDVELAEALEKKISECLALAEALHAPFDREIATTNAEGRARVQALIIALNEQEGLLEEAFRLFGFDVPETE